MKPLEQSFAAERVPKKFPNFFQLSGEEIASLQRDITDSEGLVRIFVHPSFRSENSSEWNENAPGETRAAIEHLLVSGSEDLPPTLIFEDKHEVPLLQARLANKIKSGVYVVPTEPYGAPWPAAGSKNVDENWVRFKTQLKQLGVKRIIVGGLNLFLDSDDLDERHEHTFGTGETDSSISGCVGATINHLKDPDFEVKLSNLSYPDAQEEKRARRGQPIAKIKRNFHPKDL